MISEEEKYNRILNILRKSEPNLTDANEIEEAVMKEIQKRRDRKAESNNVFDYLFGWVYISWIRKGLIAASFMIIGLFAFQQTLILKRIKLLERQAIISEDRFTSNAPADLDEKLLLYKLSGRKSIEKITISERQLNRLMKSYDDLETRYSDLLKLIEEDPVMKQYFEKKLSEKNKRKFNM
jgi:hypothetical protein